MSTDPAQELAVISDRLHELHPMLYVIQGTTGEYSDRREWSVSAHLLEAEAEKACEVLNAWCLKNKVHYDTPRAQRRNRGFGEEEDEFNATSPDPYFQTDYTGTSYDVQWVSFGRPHPVKPA